MVDLDVGKMMRMIEIWIHDSSSSSFDFQQIIETTLIFPIERKKKKKEIFIIYLNYVLFNANCWIMDIIFIEFSRG